MRRPLSITLLAGTAALVAAGGLLAAGCSASSQEPYKDAHRSGANTGSAETITMPDGFSNAATKCDHGNRVYTIYHSTSKYGAIAVVAHDPSCPQPTPSAGTPTPTR